MTTFKPLTQNKNSNQKYNGPGFIPCNGLLPCQLDHFPAEYNHQRKEGQMAEWNGVAIYGRKSFLVFMGLVLGAAIRCAVPLHL